jgi:Protein of unknown function (DUF2950)
MKVITSLKIALIRSLLSLVVLCIVLTTVGTVQAGAKTTRKFFTSPEEAVQRLVAAVQNNDRKELLAILGPGSQPIVSSGDRVADRNVREWFVKLYQEKQQIEGADTGRAILIIGNEEHRFPVPIVKRENSWYFDAKAGREELLNRRIGNNELEVIELLRDYADAQREYAAKDRVGDGVTQFARKFRSTPGRKDGLYWETKEGEEESPFGELAAKAAREGYLHVQNARHASFHGYYFKILTAQGAHATGGAFDYVVNGRMILGFALVAYPARYGVSGIMTFIVNQNGVIHQKDLGSKTVTIAARMKRYDPDPGWKKAE